MHHEPPVVSTSLGHTMAGEGGSLATEPSGLSFKALAPAKTAMAEHLLFGGRKGQIGAGL